MQLPSCPCLNSPLLKSMNDDCSFLNLQIEFDRVYHNDNLYFLSSTFFIFFSNILLLFITSMQWRFYDGANGGPPVQSQAPQFGVKPPSFKLNAPSPNLSPLGHHKILGLSPSSLTSLKSPLPLCSLNFIRFKDFQLTSTTICEKSVLKKNYNHEIVVVVVFLFSKCKQAPGRLPDKTNRPWRLWY